MTAAPTSSQIFGERVRELRQKRGLTQADLSERSGYAQGRISEIERGERVPTLNTMIRLARALECKPTALISPFDKADLSALALK